MGKKMVRRIVLFLITFFICFPVFAQEQDKSKEFITDKINGVIISPEDANRYYRCNYGETTSQGYFTPSREDVERSVNQLFDFLKRSDASGIGLILNKDFRTYYKTRFIGVICGNQKKIWMSFLAPEEGLKWDGDWFTVFYDIKDESFFHLEIHKGHKVRLYPGGIVAR